MKEKIVQFLKGNFFSLLIVLITASLSLVNYQPGTWLSGWDTLHPEFNFSLNFKRVINGVWRAEQGLGAVAGHSHMADLPHLEILFLLSLIFPIYSLRYLYIFLTLITGPLGIYYFLERVILKNQPDGQRKVASFLGAMFYLLNLGTLQHFYVPFEMFNVQYATLGWLFLFATRFLENRNKKDFVLFSVSTFLATPQAYAATLWYAYFLALTFYLFVFSFPTLMKRNFRLGKKAVILIAATLIINSYWLLPNIYFVLNHASAVPLAKINRMFSEEAFLHTLEYGNIKDTAILKNFLFSWAEYDGQGSFKYLLDEWIKHLDMPIVLAIGYLAFTLVVLGFIISLWKRKKTSSPLASIFLLSLIFLINSSPGISQLFTFLRNHFLVLKEALRFPFTKFSILLMFSYAVYFGLALSYILGWLKRVFKHELLINFSLLFLISTALIFYMLPAFQGNLISPSMKIKIPDEYFQMFNWFNKQGEGRVAKLPIHTFWGWVYHNWGYQGAGFIWFGLKQPILERDFDRWTPYNEQYYREMSYAVYSQNLPLLEQVLDKYQIRWILLDKSIIAPGNESKVLYIKEIEETLSASKKVKLVKNFGNNLKVYEVKLNPIKEIYQSFQLAETENLSDEAKQKIFNQTPSKISSLIAYELFPKLIFSLELSQVNLLPSLCSPQNSNQVFGVTLEDVNGFRILAKNGITCVKIPLFPFLKKDLDQKILIEVKFNYQPETDEKPLICLYDNRLGRCAGQRFPNYYFELRDGINNYQLQFSLDALGSDKEKSILYKNINLVIYGQVEETKIPELIQEAGSFDITSLSRQPESCNATKPVYFDRKIIEENGSRYIEYLSEKGSSCDSFSYPQLTHDKGYALVIESRNIEGLPLRLCLVNHTTRHCDLYTELPRNKEFKKEVYLIPPSNGEKGGYDVNVDNYSIGKIRSINHLKSIQIFPVTYDWAQLTKREFDENNFVFLNQAFEKNWFALEYKKPFSIKPLKAHILVNNWANGWLLENGEPGKIVFIFLPQYLEYFGFLLFFLFGCFTLIFLVK